MKSNICVDFLLNIAYIQAMCLPPLQVSYICWRQIANIYRTTSAADPSTGGRKLHRHQHSLIVNPEAHTCSHTYFRIFPPFDADISHIVHISSVPTGLTTCGSVYTQTHIRTHTHIE